MPLHPFLSAMLQALAGQPAISDGSPEDGRALISASRARIGTGPAMALRRELAVPTRDGTVPALLLVPEGPVAGSVVFFHGGGWVIGAPSDYEPWAATLAARAGAAVLVVDYRLAPEHPFPAGLNDCRDALAAALAGRISDLPPGPIVVAGDSAGANLATVCCADLSPGQSPVLQLLYYPVTDCDFTRQSYRTHGTGLPLLARDMEWFFRHYAPESAWKSPEISPLSRPSTAVPALVITAEYDVLADEGIAYAKAFEAAGGQVRHRHIEGVTHGFIRLHNLMEPADQELTRVAAEVAAALKAA